jgi:hypothetical protein
LAEIHAHDLDPDIDNILWLARKNSTNRYRDKKLSGLFDLIRPDITRFVMSILLNSEKKSIAMEECDLI